MCKLKRKLWACGRLDPDTRLQRCAKAKTFLLLPYACQPKEQKLGMKGPCSACLEEEKRKEHLRKEVEAQQRKEREEEENETREKESQKPGTMRKKAKRGHMIGEAMSSDDEE
jgi:hypothetical protein